MSSASEDQFINFLSMGYSTAHMEINVPEVYLDMKTGAKIRKKERLEVIQGVLRKLPLELRVEGEDSSLLVFSNPNHWGRLHIYPDGTIFNYRFYTNGVHGSIYGKQNTVGVDLDHLRPSGLISRKNVFLYFNKRSMMKDNRERSKNS